MNTNPVAAQLRPLRVADLQPLTQAAAADQHVVLWPTHVVERAGDLVGYVSVCATPIVNVWLDSRRVQALDSVRLLAQLEASLRFNGVERYIMPCAQQSPFAPHMQHLGFTELGSNVWWLKNLKMTNDE